MSNYVDCRCPDCGHIRGQADEGSGVKLQCRQCRIFVRGRVTGGKFVVKSTERVRRQVESAGPPKYIG